MTKVSQCKRDNAIDKRAHSAKEYFEEDYSPSTWRITRAMNVIQRVFAQDVSCKLRRELLAVRVARDESVFIRLCIVCVRRCSMRERPLEKKPVIGQTHVCTQL